MEWRTRWRREREKRVEKIEAGRVAAVGYKYVEVEVGLGGEK